MQYVICRYYAAFPALSDKCDELMPKAQKTPEDKVWAKVASKLVGEESSCDSSGSSGPEPGQTGKWDWILQCSLYGL